MRRELGLEIGGGRPPAGLHLHHGLHERTQFVRQPGQVGPLTQQHEDGLDGVGTMERRMSGGGEDQRRAEGEDIARARHTARVTGLLGRHIGGRADGDVGHRQSGVGHPGGDTEVDHPGAVLDDQHIRRFQVTVHQAGAVDGLKRLGDPCRQPAHRLGRERPALIDYFLEGGRGDIGRREPGHGRPRIGVHHRGRVEAADRAGRLHLACEADPEQLVLGELGTHRLDRHAPAGRRTRQIDQAHAAGPETAEHLERADPPGIVLRQLLQLLHHLPATSPWGVKKRLSIATSRREPLPRAASPRLRRGLSKRPYAC